MILRNLTVLVFLAALLSLPGVRDARAQEPPVTGAERTHVVREGETLASIARTYYDDAARWQALFEANRSLLDDPDRILPGMELAVPGTRAGVSTGPGAGVEGIEVIRGRPDGPLADVTGVELRSELAAPSGPVPEVVGLAERRELMRTRPFTPLGQPEVGTTDRTVFYGTVGPGAPEAIRPGVIVTRQEEALAVPHSVVQSAAWLVPEGGDAGTIGRIGDFEGDRELRVYRTTLQPFDQVRLELDASASLAVGDRVLSFHDVGELDGTRILAPSGVLEIRRLESEGAIARLVGEFDRVQLGHHLIPTRSFPLQPGVHPSPVETGAGGSLVGFRDRKEIYLPGDQAFVDLGRAAGLVVGDELEGRVGGADGRDGRRVARFQVIGVQEETATVRILSVESPSAVRPGLELVVDRKMP